MRKVLPIYHQHINFPTRGDQILDHCYSQIWKSYKPLPCPAFGKSDHTSIMLIPTYRQRLKQEKKFKKSFSGQYNAGVLNPLALSRTALKQQIGRCSVLQLMGTLTNTQTLSLHTSPNASMMSSLGSVLGLSQTKSPG